ncbi:MAG: pyridoxamine 5'-phosphate oxidase family protein [Deltaproteobacteria bacterium]|nr:pyridoxamine 5'-phosphate oxidase family protein [Deltaproteobacteria bacterium]
MRRKEEEITDIREIEKLLKECTVGRLATMGRDGFPYITPLNYVYHQGAIYFHSAPAGEKLENIAANPQVCFEVDTPLAYLDTAYDPDKPPCAVSQLYKSVIIRGRAEIIESMEEKVAALNALMASHERVEEFIGITEDQSAVKRCVVVVVHVEFLTAKTNDASRKSGAEKEKIREYLKKRDLEGDRNAARQIV